MRTESKSAKEAESMMSRNHQEVVLKRSIWEKQQEVITESTLLHADISEEFVILNDKNQVMSLERMPKRTQDDVTGRKDIKQPVRAPQGSPLLLSKSPKIMTSLERMMMSQIFPFSRNDKR